MKRFRYVDLTVDGCWEKAEKMIRAGWKLYSHSPWVMILERSI